MKKSKLFGSTLIIAGTTIGAGMLALPLASAGIGFTTSLLIMITLWALMAFTALLMIEVHQYADKSATLHTLALQILGEKGKWLASFSMLFLFYALCAAYIAGGGEQFTQRISNLLDFPINHAIGTLMFTFIVAMIIVIGTGAVDKVNRLLFVIKMIAMVIALAFLAPNISQPYLLSMPLQQGLIMASVPVIFTSFGFHGSIPAIVNYLDGDTHKLRKAILIGSALPLIIYIFWQLVTLGVIEQTNLVQNSTLNELIALLSQTVHQSNLGAVIGIFADLALLTSFLGVSLGLFEFIKDALNKKKKNNSVLEETSYKNRIIASLMTFTPPFIFALFYPKGFIMALGYAAIALAILAIFLPVAMVYKVRQNNQGTYYQVQGGNIALIISLFFGLIVVVSQLLISFKVLPNLG